MFLRTSAILVTTTLSSIAHGADINVSTATEIVNAFGSASAGDRIIIAPGEYSFGAAVWTGNNGPITVTTTEVGAAKLNFDSIEALVFNHADWTLENVWVNGVCAGESCEAGVGVKWGALRFKMQHVRVSNWTQHVKAARDSNNEVEDAQILNSEFWNDALRPNGATPLDLVGGKRWRIIGNYIHDYGGDPNGDYGIFLKGGTSNGIIESNLVICAQDNSAGGATLGISFGGGGTGYSFCPNQNCDCEDYDSIARNNLVLHCTDAGLHTKRACGSKFYNNTVYDVGAGLQIQINGAGAPVDVQNNVLGGGISGPGDLYTASSNLLNVEATTFRAAYADPDEADFRSGNDPSLFEDQGANLADVAFDYCGSRRNNHDMGAIEFPAACETWPWAGAAVIPPAPDAGVSDTGPRDTGSSSPDASPGPDGGAGPSDAGVGLDAGSRPQADAGQNAPRADAGGSAPEDPSDLSGGCSISSSTDAGLVWLLGLGVCLLSGRRRRSAG